MISEQQPQDKNTTIEAVNSLNTEMHNEVDLKLFKNIETAVEKAVHPEFKKKLSVALEQFRKIHGMSLRKYSPETKKDEPVQKSQMTPPDADKGEETKVKNRVRKAKTDIEDEELFIDALKKLLKRITNAHAKGANLDIQKKDAIKFLITYKNKCKNPKVDERYIYIINIIQASKNVESMIQKVYEYLKYLDKPEIKNHNAMLASRTLSGIVEELKIKAKNIREFLAMDILRLRRENPDLAGRIGIIMAQAASNQNKKEALRMINQLTFTGGKDIHQIRIIKQVMALSYFYGDLIIVIERMMREGTTTSELESLQRLKEDVSELSGEYHDQAKEEYESVYQYIQEVTKYLR